MDLGRAGEATREEQLRRFRHHDDPLADLPAVEIGCGGLPTARPPMRTMRHRPFVSFFACAIASSSSDGSSRGIAGDG